VEVLGGVNEGDRLLVDTSHRAPGVVATEVVVDAGQAARRISTVAVTERTLSYPVTIGGRLTFDDLRVTHVFSPVGGRIVRLIANPGDHVKAGAPLAVLLSPDLGTAFSDVLKAKADLIAAEHEVTRQRELFEAKAGSARDLQVAQDNHRRAEAEYNRVRQKARMLHGGTENTVTQEFVLRSPIEGDVVARAANPGLEVQGQYSGSGNTVELFTIGRIDQLWLIGDLYEADLPRVQRGAELDVEVSTYPGRTFSGVVDWISDALDPVQRTAKVRCVLSNADRLLRPEMYGTVRIVSSLRNVVTVPRDAIMRSGDETMVFVKDPGGPDDRVGFRRRRVVIDEQVPGDSVPVMAGLTVGELVATRGAIFLLGM
jgi:cobalt-zinc-cadmium efflux system membrane fusion protein